MDKLAPLPLMAVLLSSGCAHAAPTSNSAANVACADSPIGSRSGDKSSVQSAALLTKFDPALRWALHDKTGGLLHALVDLTSPLPAEIRTELEAQGLVFFSATNSLLHVRGDAQALLRLAARSEVKRIHASGPMKPSQKE